MKKTKSTALGGMRSRTKTIEKKSPSPGIYRVRVERCKAEHISFGGWHVVFDFEVRGPVQSVDKLRLCVDSESRAGTDYLRRVFAVAGVTVDTPRDLALACREVVGRQLFVELVPDGELHVLQLATTHCVAAPESAWSDQFPDADCQESGHSTEDPDLSDPRQPRFHACSVTDKAELRLDPVEVIRVARAAAGE